MDHHWVRREAAGSGFRPPGIRSARLLGYYRFVYDGVYHIAPGGFLRASDGSVGGKIGDLPRGRRSDVAFENALREIFVDVELEDAPVRLRIGRQQIVWGNTIGFRVLDAINAFDLSWHLAQEIGILGRAGFSEIRKPAWTVAASWSWGTIGPLTGVALEIWDIPFDFQPTELRFLPAPWSVNLRNPFRPGLVADAGEEGFGLPGVFFVQPCFDATGNTEPNETANPDFSDSAETGFCHAEGKRSRPHQGLYDRRNPLDVNQAGARLLAQAPLGIYFTVNYMHRRALVDTGAAFSKVHTGVVGSAPQDYLEIAPHSTTDPATRETRDVAGYIRVPIEFYYPYVHVFGASLEAYERWTRAVWNFEVSWTHDQPVAANSPTGIRNVDLVAAALNLDRPTWVPWFNRAATWLVLGQLNLIWSPEHREIFGEGPGTPIPRHLRDAPDFDRARELELLTLFALQSFYRKGTVTPLLVWLSDWGNAPNMMWTFLLQYRATAALVLEAGLTLFYTDGRIVDDPWAFGQLENRDEVTLKARLHF